MTYWRDELRPASFRGVPFFVETVTRTGGQHADEQVFPGRATPAEAVHVEHLGAGPERFAVDAFVVGPEYRSARDALEAALAQPGSGRLVHPYRGERVVSVVGKVQTTEGRQRGGWARIAFTVVVTEGPTLRRTPDTAAVIARDLDAFLADLARDFEVQYDEDVPDAFQAASQSTFADAVGTLEGLYFSVLSGVGDASDFATDVADFADDLVAAPFDAARSLIGAFGRIASAPGRLLGAAQSLEQRGGAVALSLMAAMRPLIAFGEELEAIAATTANRTAEARQRDAVVQLVRGAAIGATARAVGSLPFDSRADATAVRDEIVDALDRLVDEGSPSGDTVSGARLYEAIATARAATVAHLSAVARTLPELDTYVVTAALPALVIAHELYADARREAEIVARNDPPTPGWIPIGTELEVVRG